MKLRILKYIVAWLVLNAALSLLWVALKTGPDVAFILGILHGGVSQAGLAYLFMERQRT
jgi:hypothetical protein